MLSEQARQTDSPDHESSVELSSINVEPAVQSPSQENTASQAATASKSSPDAETPVVEFKEEALDSSNPQLSTCARIGKFLKQDIGKRLIWNGILSFYDDGLPPSLRKTPMRLATRIGQTAFSIYEAWVFSSGAQARAEDYAGLENSKGILALGALTFSVAFWLLQKGAGKGILFVTTLSDDIQAERELNAHTRIVVREALSICADHAHATSSMADDEESQRKATRLAQRFTKLKHEFETFKSITHLEREEEAKAQSRSWRSMLPRCCGGS